MSRGLHYLFVRAPARRAGRELFVAPNGITDRASLVGVGQISVDALPKRLSEQNALSKWKRYRLGSDLLG